MTQHALLSASSAHRWLHCTGAPRFEATFPDTTSDFAREGTLAHAIAELKVRRYAVEPMSQATFTRRHNKLKKEELYAPEMEGYTDDYLERIKQIMLAYKVKPYTVVEKRVDFSDYVPEGFGTADCLVMTADDLHVIDFKYGKGVPVDAVGNPQMRLYALGALKQYGVLYQFKQVHMHIIQPRIGNYSEDQMTPEALKDWGETVVKPKAQEAFDKKNDHFEPGEWCRFCRAKGCCAARAEHYAEYEPCAMDFHDPRVIDDQRLSNFLVVAKELEDWAKDLQEYALSACLSGKQIPGWKAVEGRGSRIFTDQEDAFEVLRENGIPDEILYNRVPLTLAQTEKVVGKKKFAELVGSLIEKKPGKPTLARESDKRPAICNTVTAADVFQPVKGE